MNEHIKVGADIHAGDGGYSIGVQEKHDAFVKVRNKSLARARIRNLANAAGYTEDMFGIGHWDMPECKMFVELIVRECIDQVWYTREDMINENISEVIKDRIKEYFGVE